MQLLINPSNLDDLISIDEVLIIGLHPFSHSINCIFDDINELIAFTNKHPKSYYLYLNHLINQTDLPLLQSTLELISNTNIKVMLEDYAILQICNDLNLNIDLILASKNSVTSAGLINASDNKIKMALVSNDLAIDDLNYLLANVNKPVIIHGLGYQNIYYSKRPVVSNYLNTFDINPQTNYYLRLKDKHNYPIIEEAGYSYIYSDKLFNIINLIPELVANNDNYLLLNSYMMDQAVFNNYITQFQTVLKTNAYVPLPDDSSNYQLTNPNYYKVKNDA